MQVQIDGEDTANEIAPGPRSDYHPGAINIGTKTT